MIFSPAGGGGRFRISLRIRITKRRPTAKKAVSSAASLGSLPGLTFPSNNHKLTSATPVKARLDKLILDRIGERYAMNCELFKFKIDEANKPDLLMFAREQHDADIRDANIASFFNFIELLTFT